MTRPDLDARLRAALVTADEMIGREGVDMSAEAITGRIAELAEMSSLCLALLPEARDVTQVESVPPKDRRSEG